MKIPKPASLTKYKPLGRLHDAMKLTHLTEKSFHQFKRWARMCMAKLNFKKPAHLQGARWGQFLEDMLFVEPQLAQYDDHWPLEFYYNFCHLRHNKKARIKPQEVIDVDVSEVDSDSDSDIIWIDDKPRPITSGPSISSTLTSYSSRRSVSTSTGRPGSSQNAVSPAPPLAPPDPPAPPAPIVQQNEPNDQTQTTAKVAVYASCMFCEAPIVADPVCNAKLRAFVGQDRYTQILARHGIRFDQHLEILLRMDNSLKDTFFQNLSMDGISPLGKFQLCRLFSASKTASSSQAPQAGGPKTEARASPDIPFIPPPSLEVQANLSSAALSVIDFGPDLRNAMKLDDDEAFDDIMNVMDLTSRSFFFTYAPNMEQLEQVLKLILQQRQLQFGRYHNYWPIRLYMKRRKAIFGTTSQFTAEEEEALYEDIFNTYHGISPGINGALSPQSISTKPGQGIPPGIPPAEIDTESSKKPAAHVVQIPCKLHAPIDISSVAPKLKEYLDRIGMPELIPALIHAGITTDNDFDALSRLGFDDLITVISFGKVNLSDFQKFILKAIFPSVKVLSQSRWPF